MARRKQPNTLADLEALAETSAIAAATAATAHPAVVLKQVAQVVDKWRDDGKPFLFIDNQEVSDYYRASVERILVSMLRCMELTIEQLVKRIEEAAGDPDCTWDIHDLLRIAESMSSQLSTMKSAQQPKASAPKDATEVERRIAELEERRAKRITYESN